MSVNKSFIVKYGIDVANELLVASTDLGGVGIGSTLPKAALDVKSNMHGVDGLYTGILTATGDYYVGTGGTVFTASSSSGNVGFGTTSNPLYRVSVSGAGTTALYVNGNAEIVGNLKISGASSFPELIVTGVSTLGETSTTDLTSQQVVVSGVSTFTGNIDANGDLDVDGHTDLDDLVVSGVSTYSGLVDMDGGGRSTTFKVEDLTDNRVVIAGTGGELEDSANLTFNGSIFNVTGHTELDSINASEYQPLQE